MTKVPNNPNPQIQPGAVLGSESLPFESMIFSNEPQAPASAPAQPQSASRYVAGDDAAKRLTEAPLPAFPKIFRPNSSSC